MSLELKREKVSLLEQQNFYKANLPHKYGHKLYQWQHDFIHSPSQITLGSAANQIGKSSASYIRLIEFITNPKFWKKFFQGRQPKVGWIFFTDLDTATAEFNDKMKDRYLPREGLRNDPRFGWKESFDDKGKIQKIIFNIGFTLYFKSYQKKPDNIQSATLDIVVGDEEMPENFFNEIILRVEANDGYYWNVFTATRGEEYLRLALEPEEDEEEKFPEAKKFCVSMYDCLKYMDGTPSTVWTLEKIKKLEAKLSSDDEILRRIWGRFVLSSGRTYQSFTLGRNLKPPTYIPADWKIYSGMDMGSGGEKNHPAAIAYVAVCPDYKRARVVQCWRGDKIETTSGFVVDKWIEKRPGNKDPEWCKYDPNATDVGYIAKDKKLPFLKAKKDQEGSQNLLNTLFKNGQLIIDDTPDGEGRKLAVELRNLLKKTRKQEAKDDLIDALRYAIFGLPFKFEYIPEDEEEEKKVSKPKKKEEEIEPRLREYMRAQEEEDYSIQRELNNAAMMFEDYYD